MNRRYQGSALQRAVDAIIGDAIVYVVSWKEVKSGRQGRGQYRTPERAQEMAKSLRGFPNLYEDVVVEEKESA